MNRRFKIILTVSVLLNMLLIGALAGSCYKRMGGPRDFRERMEGKNPKFAKAMEEAREGQKELRDQMKTAKKGLVEALSAPEFSEEQFRAAADKMRAAQDAMFTARNDATVKMAKEMSVEERREMAEHVKNISGRHDRGERDKMRPLPE